MHTGIYSYCSINRSILSHPGDVTMWGGGFHFLRCSTLLQSEKSCVHSTILLTLELFTISVPLYGHHFFLRDRVEHFCSCIGDPYSQQAKMFITRCADLSLLGRYFLFSHLRAVLRLA